jgi:hypothetical protein
MDRGTDFGSVLYEVMAIAPPPPGALPRRLEASVAPVLGEFTQSSQPKGLGDGAETSAPAGFADQQGLPVPASGTRSAIAAGEVMSAMRSMLSAAGLSLEAGQERLLEQALELRGQLGEVQTQLQRAKDVGFRLFFFFFTYFSFSSLFVSPLLLSLSDLLSTLLKTA